MDDSTPPIAQMVVTWEGPVIKDVAFPQLGLLTDARIELALPRIYRALRMARIEEARNQQVSEVTSNQG